MDTWVLTAHWGEEKIPEDLLVQLVPPERLGRLGRPQMEERRQVCAAYAMLRRAAARLLGCASVPELSYGLRGKPCFAAYPQLQFSLSHTEGAALCALSDRAVGADVERIRPVTAQRARRLRLSETPEEFYAGWVERESRVKCRGGSALSCRRPVAEETGEHYRTLDVGREWAAGLCTLSCARVHREDLYLPELLKME